jgi:anti-anti-sigma factor
MSYEEFDVTLAADESVLFYSDGLVEAHNQQREMFGFPRLMEMLSKHPGDTTLIDSLLNELATFTGASWEQEDDVTLVRVQRVAVPAVAEEPVLTNAYTQANTPTTRIIVINFSELTYMNSSGIGLLVTLLIRINRQKQRLLCYGLSDHYRHIFALTRLSDAIPIYDTEQGVLEAAKAL